MRWYVIFLKDRKTVTHGFDTEPEAVHFAGLVCGTIIKGW